MSSTESVSRSFHGCVQARHRAVLAIVVMVVAVIGLGAPAASAHPAGGVGNGVAAINLEPARTVGVGAAVFPAGVGLPGPWFDDGAGGSFVASSVGGGLSGVVRRLGESDITGTGATALGRDQGCVSKANSCGASCFDVGETWNPLFVGSFGKPGKALAKGLTRADEAVVGLWYVDDAAATAARFGDETVEVTRRSEVAVDVTRGGDDVVDVTPPRPTGTNPGRYDPPPAPAGAAPSGARACSFTGATLVLMADGSRKPIEDVEVGDEVLATDPDTGETVARTVTQRWVHGDTVVDLVVDGDVISTTEDHPFWNHTDGEWQRADELDPGDRVRAADGDLLEVEGIDWASTRTTIAYNLSVDDIHTYYVGVGHDTALVHNTCSTPNTPSGTPSAQAAGWQGKGAYPGVDD